MKKLINLLILLVSFMMTTSCEMINKTNPNETSIRPRVYLKEPRFYEPLVSDMYLFEIIDITDVISFYEKRIENHKERIVRIKIIRDYNNIIYDNLDTKIAATLPRPYYSLKKDAKEIDKSWILKEGQEYNLYLVEPFENFAIGELYIAKIKSLYLEVKTDSDEYVLRGLRYLYPVVDDAIEYDKIREKEITYRMLVEQYYEEVNSLRKGHDYYERDGVFYILEWNLADIIENLLFLNNHIDDPVKQFRDGMTLDEFEEWLLTIKQSQIEFYGWNIYEYYPTLNEKYTESSYGRLPFNR